MSEPRAASRSHAAVRRADLALLVLTLALSALTTLVLVVPAIVPAILNDRFDVTIVTSAWLVSAAVSGLAWGRGRVASDSAAVLRGSAFAVLALLSGLALLAVLVGADPALGASLEAPGQLPIIASVLARGLSAVLLVAAGVAALSRRAPNLHPALVLVGPSAVVLILLLLGAANQDLLPALAPPETLGAIASNPTAPLAPGSAPALVVIQSLIGAAFVVAALLAHRSFRRSARAGDALLAAGFLVAAFSQMHSAIHPGSYTAAGDDRRPSAPRLLWRAAGGDRCRQPRRPGRPARGNHGGSSAR